MLQNCKHHRSGSFQHPPAVPATGEHADSTRSSRYLSWTWSDRQMSLLLWSDHKSLPLPGIMFSSSSPK